MSIAVSAVVRPSLRLRLLQAGFAAGLIGAAAAGRALAWPPACCAASLLAGALLLLSLARPAKARHIDISGVGQIRLTVYQSLGLNSADHGAGHREDDLVQLLAGSTLWPGVLLLRLGGADGRVATLVVLPDSVAEGAFRRLALACRVLAARSAQRS